MVFKFNQFNAISNSDVKFFFTDERLLELAHLMHQKLNGASLDFVLTGEHPQVQGVLEAKISAGRMIYLSRVDYTGPRPPKVFLTSLALGKATPNDVKTFLESREKIPKETLYVSHIGKSAKSAACETQDQIYKIETLEAAVLQTIPEDKKWDELKVSGKYHHTASKEDAVRYIMNSL